CAVCIERLDPASCRRTSGTAVYTLSLHDALPIWRGAGRRAGRSGRRLLRPGRSLPAGDAADRPHPLRLRRAAAAAGVVRGVGCRSEEHTSELQSRENLVCRLLLEKKKKRCRIKYT